jgi:hypothetical protein
VLVLLQFGEAKPQQHATSSVAVMVTGAQIRYDSPMPRVCVFDVNETLLDLRALDPAFAQVFGTNLRSAVHS